MKHVRFFEVRKEEVEPDIKEVIEELVSLGYEWEHGFDDETTVKLLLKQYNDEIKKEV